MHDARRFLRFVLPGLVSAIVAGFLFFLIDPNWTVLLLHALKKDSGLAVVLAGILASGGLGYLLSTLHHELVWFGSEGILDFRQMLVALQNRQIVQFEDFYSAEDIKVGDLTRQDAWGVFTTLWHERTKSSLLVQAADTKAEALADLLHSIGAARMANQCAAFSVFLTAMISLNFSPTWRAGLGYVAAIAVASLLEYLFRRTLARTSRFLVQFIGQSLIDALVAEKDQNARPVRARVARLDQKRLDNRKRSFEKVKGSLRRA